MINDVLTGLNDNMRGIMEAFSHQVKARAHLDIDWHYCYTFQLDHIRETPLTARVN